MSPTQWYGLARDESSDEDGTFCKILVRHIGNVSEQIETSLLDMPNINSGSTAQEMYDACNEVVKNNFSLSWDTLVIHLTIQTHRTKEEQGNQKVLM